MRSHTSDETASAPSVTLWDDGYILLSRANGYLAAIPPVPLVDGMTDETVKAANMGRAGAALRALQAKVEAWRKDDKVDNASIPMLAHRFASDFHVSTDTEVRTVGDLRREIATAMATEMVDAAVAAGKIAADKRDASIRDNTPRLLAHPKHAAAIAARLDAKMNEYVAPVKRAAKGTTQTEDAGVTLDLDDC